MGRLWKLSDEEERQIVKEYKSGHGCKELSVKYHVTKSSILRVAKKFGVALGRGFVIRKYGINENAFDDMTDTASYWIGFLLADGCIRRAGCLQLGISEKDYSHLEKFKLFLQCAHPIKIETRSSNKGYGKGKLAKLTIGSKHMCTILRSYGVVSRKSLIAKADMRLIENRHFWRGVVDGDGWIVKSTPSIGLCSGSYDLIKQFASFVKSVCPQWKGHPYKDGSVVLLKGKHAVQLMNKLYCDNPIALERKELLVKKWLKGVGQEVCH